MMFPLPSDKKMCTSVCLSLCLFMRMLRNKKSFKKNIYMDLFQKKNMYIKRILRK